MSKLEKLQAELRRFSNPEKIEVSKYFFKTGKGQYGEGDEFIGISMPKQREVIKEFKDLSLNEISAMLSSPIHEFRMSALLILVEQFKKAKTEKRSEIYEFYLKNVENINNWDLVDCSSRDIVGAYLFDKDRSKLYELAATDYLWSQRIAVVSTWYFIRKNQFNDTFRLAEMLLTHKHDLMHKAVGWMLREVWGKDELAVEEFLDEHAPKMPRTMLRYAIEKMNEPKRKYYLSLKVNKS
jgi:3-methyladenine DNA glycosylase AlkD